MKIDQKLLEESRKRLQNPQYLEQVMQAMDLLGISWSETIPQGCSVSAEDENLIMKTYTWKKTNGGYTTVEPASGANINLLTNKNLPEFELDKFLNFTIANQKGAFSKGGNYDLFLRGAI